MAKPGSTGSGRPRGASSGASLIIRTTGARVRAPHLLFNRLTRRIGTLQRRLVTERGRLDGLLDRFLAVVAPVETELARRRLELARAISAAHARWPLREHEKEDASLLILTLLTGSFVVVDPDEDAIALYDEWSGSGYREDLRADAAAGKANLRDAFRAQYGFDADVADDGDDTEDGLHRFRRLMREQVHRAEEARTRQSDADSGRRGGMRRRKDPEEIRLKSVRAIYLTLAKLLHPDANVSGGEREQREHDMKRAAEAYRQEDLVTLLELERRWGARGHDELRDLGDDVFDAYIATLRKRAAHLEGELRAQKHDERYARVAPVAGLTNVKAFAGIESRAAQLRDDVQLVERQLADLAACRGKRELARLIEDFLGYDEWILVPARRRRRKAAPRRP